ncbi:MAG: hypothetical protein FJ295_02395 [Planctomycetes bacterium]|nr:hypothetical protein [Planctomycetota bacterium]
MLERSRAKNPFYVLLVLSGVAFTVTACAYGVMTVRGLRPETAIVDDQAGGLLPFLDRHGGKLMLAEITVLAASSLLAMLTDDYWNRQNESIRS